MFNSFNWTQIRQNYNCPQDAWRVCSSAQPLLTPHCRRSRRVLHAVHHCLSTSVSPVWKCLTLFQENIQKPSSGSTCKAKLLFTKPDPCRKQKPQREMQAEIVCVKTGFKPSPLYFLSRYLRQASSVHFQKELLLFVKRWRYMLIPWGLLFLKGGAWMEHWRKCPVQQVSNTFMSQKNSKMRWLISSNQHASYLQYDFRESDSLSETCFSYLLNEYYKGMGFTGLLESTEKTACKCINLMPI